jgi:hypothetical protein
MSILKHYAPYTYLIFLTRILYAKLIFIMLIKAKWRSHTNATILTFSYYKLSHSVTVFNVSILLTLKQANPFYKNTP